MYLQIGAELTERNEWTIINNEKQQKIILIPKTIEKSTKNVFFRLSNVYSL